MIKTKKFAVPTVYNDIQFRSRFEARIAFWLDSLKIKWEYEGKAFVLKKGKLLWPDFCNRGDFCNKAV